MAVKLELTTKQFRRLLDLAYIGNWILNSARGDDRIPDFDEVESALFGAAAKQGMEALAERCEGAFVPSQAFTEGGIHEAIIDYENTVFFDILAEELARRDMAEEPTTPSDFEELARRIDEYIVEFEENGTDNILLDS